MCLSRPFGTRSFALWVRCCSFVGVVEMTVAYRGWQSLMLGGEAHTLNESPQCEVTIRSRRLPQWHASCNYHCRHILDMRVASYSIDVLVHRSRSRI